MKKVIAVCVLYFCFFSVSVQAEDNPSIKKNTRPQVTLYLKSGEIIKGDLMAKTPDTVTIEKLNSTLSLKVNDILKMTEGGVGSGLWGKYLLPFSTAIITYELKGLEKGKETVYIDVLNNKIAIEISAGYAGFGPRQNMLRIYDGDLLYTIILEERRGVSLKTKDAEIGLGLFGEQFYFGNTVSQESFLGKDCNVYKLDDGEAFYWCGLLLKREFSGSPMGAGISFVKEATDIKTDVPISPEKFKVPEGIKIENSEELAYLRDKEEQKKDAEDAEKYKKELLEKSEKDPAAKKILKEITKEDGTLDIEKYIQLKQKRREEKILDEVKAMEGGAALIQEATGKDGSVDMAKLQGLAMQKTQEKYEAEASESYKKYLVGKASANPEIKTILEACTGKDGKLDINKAQDLMKAQEEKELLEKARKFKDGEMLIQKATDGMGAIDLAKLTSLVWEKENELRTKATSLIDAGRVFEEQKKYAEALQKYTEAIETDPLNSIYGYQQRSRLYEVMGKNELAIQDLSEVIKNDPYSNSFNLCQRGDIYARMGKYQEAIGDYSKAIEIGNENDLKSLEAKKELLQKVGEEAAAGSLKMPLYNLDVFLKRGKAYRKISQNALAIADFTKIIEGNPGSGYLSGDAYFFRGLTYKQLKETEKMKQDLEKAESLGDKLVEGEYIGGKKQGPYVWYDTNGNISSKAIYVDDGMEGDYVHYHTNGQISFTGTYKGGKLDGPGTWYHENGKKKEEGFFKKGKKDGIFTQYDPLGNMTRRLSYANDELDGECVTLFWDDGRPVEKATYKNGVRNGMSYRYYENGQVEQAIPFEGGFENGTAILYNQDGSFKKKIIFKAGQRIQESYVP